MKKFYFLTLALICAFVANAAVTIYAKKANGLSSNANLYYWEGGLNVGWPGEAAKATEVIDGETYWKWTINPIDKFNIIFNNGSGQTADINGLSNTQSVYKFEVKNDWEKIEKLLAYLANDKDIKVLALKEAVKEVFDK